MAEKVMIFIGLFWIVVGLVTVICGFVKAIKEREFLELSIISIGLVSILALIIAGISTICSKL